MDRTQYTNLAKAWEFTEEHARERESDALTDTRTAADESGQLQGSAAHRADSQGVRRAAG